MNYNLFAKRLLDVAFASLLLALSWPIILLTSLAILLFDGHVPIYTEKRMGKNKKQFKIYKFRTMITNADTMNHVQSKSQLYSLQYRRQKGMLSDPRITSLGFFIRKYSLDELPQVLNVLKGEMSMIGPRPLVRAEFEKYKKEKKANAKLLTIMNSVKPGITGYWQVHGRSLIPFEKRIRMEVAYAQQHSLLKDLSILCRTPFAVVQAKGAY